jgi:hypothetical protein
VKEIKEVRWERIPNTLGQRGLVGIHIENGFWDVACEIAMPSARQTAHFPSIRETGRSRSRFRSAGLLFCLPAPHFNGAKGVLEVSPMSALGLGRVKTFWSGRF